QPDPAPGERPAAGTSADHAAGHRSVPGRARALRGCRLARRGGAGDAARPAHRAGGAPDPSRRAAAHPTTAQAQRRGGLRVARAGVSPRLSLVIPALNEQARLPYTLSEIEKFVCAERLDCEVIVVDNGSQDATSSVVQQASVTFPQLRLIRTD